jgi:hypothetical protein
MQSLEFCRVKERSRKAKLTLDAVRRTRTKRNVLSIVEISSIALELGASRTKAKATSNNKQYFARLP